MERKRLQDALHVLKERQALSRRRQEDSWVWLFIITCALWPGLVVFLGMSGSFGEVTGRWWFVFIAWAPCGLFLLSRATKNLGRGSPGYGSIPRCPTPEESERLRAQDMQRAEELLRDAGTIRGILELVKDVTQWIGLVLVIWAVLLSPTWLFGSWSTFFKLWIVLAPLSAIAGLPGERAGRRAKRILVLEKAEWHYRMEEAQEERGLREQQKAQAKLIEAQAKLKEAQVYREEVERFRRDRLSIERFVVGDEQAGIRSPWEVEMTDREKALLNMISSKFDPSCVLVDTYLDRGDGNGRTAQIDIIAICRQGIIVIESKGFGGTMSGKRDDAQWIHKPSQIPIQNPIEQNKGHVQSVCRVLKPVDMREDSDDDDIPF